MFQRSLLTLVTLFGLALAAPTALPSGTVTCGSNSYSPTAIQNAITNGVSHLNSPINNYPHRYRNYEGLTMRCAGTVFNEYPILTSGLYNGGSPGADRVVFDNAGNYCAVMTHTGAPTTNGFVTCRGY
ncbi:guanyl-specific ribonuclease C2 [Desarmillaria tabescens]|uniref:Guanyl-specific ribonuclease C2 n=1 Tax=Armillaria tabescens TaxID=1929756 RepID=A0AA39NNV4_ARMTA|nr:guanyl-specific ribonuclease C2 [Desarmillaria tabescens]KAK0469096.1 guanyl-specific ribonuclease C2 [Desarmillaria tabescens]